MSIGEPMLLPPDVMIVPVESLPADVRTRLDHKPGDHALTRPLTRTASTIVDANTARLLGSFQTPTRIVDAIIAFAAEHDLDPRETLDRSYPVLRELLAGGLLVPAGSELARPIAESALPDGTAVGRFRVDRTVHLIIDTQLCLAHGDGPDETEVALKVARPGHEVQLRAALAHEASMLRRLDGLSTPRLIELGEADGRPFLAMTWQRGSSADLVAAELRGLPPADGRPALVRLCRRILEAYAAIHGRGVLHGDVHPNNVLVGPDGEVTVIDLGLAAGEGERGTPRGGVDFFMEPESASAQAAGRRTAPLTGAGEQYSLAALLYLLLAGGHTHAFSLEPAAMRRQLLEEPPLPFARHGVTGLERIEAVLGRALAKDPAERFPDVAALGAAFEAAAARDVVADGETGRARGAPGALATADAASGAPRRSRGEADRLLDETLERLGPDGPLLTAELEAPRASVNLGAAGIAYGLLRVAMARDDGALLGLADLWSMKALASLGTEEAFVNAALDITPATFGRTGLHHSPTGVYLTEALIAGARWDPASQAAAVDAFLRATEEPGPERDISFGRSGILLAAAMALEALPTDSPRGVAVRERGDAIAAGLQAELDLCEPLDSRPRADTRADERFVGVAHGWAGFLYAQLRWAQATAAPVAEGVAARLAELRSLARPLGRGLAWPRERGESDDGALVGTWCNGAAGHLGLWLLASRLVDGGFARTAEAAAWTALEASPTPGDLCCGLAGRAYALLGLHRASGERIWLARARALADQAASIVREQALRADSLYKGTVGVAVLAADLSRPAEAAMPFFDREPSSVALRD
ncbi:MAG TPA: lanthionine synthetase LanC family protein [Candidatus Limnocylindrales bacterium]